MRVHSLDAHPGIGARRRAPRGPRIEHGGGAPNDTPTNGRSCYRSRWSVARAVGRVVHERVAVVLVVWHGPRARRRRVRLPGVTTEGDGDVLLVVLGAGASFDCVLPSPLVKSGRRELRPAGSAEDLEQLEYWDCRPPLTKDLVKPGPLVNRMIARYPACRPVIDDLRQRLGSPHGELELTLERALRDYQSQAERDPVLERHMLATRFFLRDYLWACTKYMISDDLTGGVTNYDTLVRLVYRWAFDTHSHVCFVDFNYDLLLEEACQSHWRFDGRDPDSYVGHPRVSIVKPHGSIQWSFPLLGNILSAPGPPATLFAIDHARERGVAENRDGHRASLIRSRTPR